MNLLQLVRDFCVLTGLPSPTVCIGTSDQQVLQILALLRECNLDIASRFEWGVLTKQATLLATGVIEQGTITESFPDLAHIKNETIYNKTTQTKIVGQLTSEEWQQLTITSATGLYGNYRIVGGSLFIIPAPTLNNELVFDYISSYYYTSSAGVPQESLLSDSDKFILPYQLVSASLRWRWKAEKGLPYSEDFRAYEALINTMKMREGTKPALSLFSPGYAAPIPRYVVTEVTNGY